MTFTRREVSALLAEGGCAPRQALGQNFVVDANTVRRVARLSEVGPGDSVVEVGAGVGSLTLALAETGASVTAVEVDPCLVRVLGRVVPPAVRVVEGDALALDWGGVLGTAGPWSLVANLPYNISVPVLALVLDSVPAVSRLLVMVQLEVGERLVAGPGSRAYGAISVKVSYWATASLVGRVPPSVFFPEPKVESALVALSRRPDRAVGGVGTPPPSAVFSLARAGFGQRRKMLRRSLAGMAPPDVLAAAFSAAGVDPAARAEHLSVEEWERLAGSLAEARLAAGVSGGASSGAASSGAGAGVGEGSS